jgi:hypothetical protein
MEANAIYRRAGGRRRYNKSRRVEMLCRQLVLIGRVERCRGWQGLKVLPHGIQRVWASEFNVSEATISRDIAAIGARIFRESAVRKRLIATAARMDECYKT